MEGELLKIEQVFQRMMKEKVFVIEDRNASYHTYTKNYPRTVKTFFRKANREYDINKMNELTEEIIYLLVDERIINYHQNYEFSESYNISAIISALTAFQKGVMTFKDEYEGWNEINYQKLRDYVKEKKNKKARWIFSYNACPTRASFSSH